MRQPREKHFIEDQGVLAFLVPPGCAVGLKYWEQRWRRVNLRGRLVVVPPNKWIRRETERHLPDRSSQILEAGCGNAGVVRYLAALGYDVWGVDNERSTVRRVNDAFPQSQVVFGDVRDTGFGQEVFDGYWSLGVIEHFPDGFSEVCVEAFRILRPGGVAFIQFPAMSLLRRLKVRGGRYVSKPTLDADDRSRFLQYALNRKEVARVFTEQGFQFVSSRGVDGCRGWLEDVPFLRGVMRKIYAGKVGWCVRALEFCLAPLMGHCALLIFRKPGT